MAQAIKEVRLSHFGDKSFDIHYLEEGSKILYIRESGYTTVMGVLTGAGMVSQSVKITRVWGDAPVEDAGEYFCSIFEDYTGPKETPDHYFIKQLEE